MSASNGAIPPGGVLGGFDPISIAFYGKNKGDDGVHGTILYVGRAEKKGSKYAGKIHPKDKRIYYDFEGESLENSNYEILIAKLNV